MLRRFKCQTLAATRFCCRQECLTLSAHVVADVRPRGPYSLELSARRAGDATRTFRDAILDAEFAGRARGRLAAAGRDAAPARDERRGVRADAVLPRVDDDHTPFVLRFQKDPFIGRAVRLLRGLRPVRTATVAQALSARALRTADPRQRGTRDGEADHPRLHGAAHRLAARAAHRSGSHTAVPARLRALGLHARRGATLVRLCAWELERLKEQPTATVADRLARERGLGPWSIGVVCLEGLGRFERGLEGDLGLVKLLAAIARATGRGLGDGRVARALR